MLPLLVALAASQSLAHDQRCLALSIQAGQLARERDEVWSFGMLREFYLGRLSQRDGKRPWLAEAKVESTKLDVARGDLAALKECTDTQELFERG